MRHPWQPIYNEKSQVLILGSFPSPRSRETGFYYGHPENCFWQVLADSLGADRLPAGAGPSQKTEFLLVHHIALWDVLQSCDVAGAADARITNPAPNDFGPLLATSQITAVFTTGRKATELFNRLCVQHTGLRAVYLPSTSPANRAQQARPEFGARWASVGRILRGETVSALGMKLADRRTIQELGTPSLTLMERAGEAVTHTLNNASDGFDLTQVLCLCGTGNNGGDGLVIARLLHAQGVRAQAVCVGNLEKMSAETAQQLAWAREAGVSLFTEGLTTYPPDQQPTTVVDALFGIGLTRPLHGEFLEAVRACNTYRKAGARVVAVDIPSGISADTGEVLGAAVEADTTVTFAASKLGLELPGSEGARHRGQLVVADIGIEIGRPL
jgi:hypoxanthine-DNA glycosylase